MLFLLSIRNLTTRPWRSALLLFGYALGVAVMIVLLSIGEALLVQARQEKLVGGGDVTVLPEGIDVEVMKTGGLGGMFLSIDHARFIYRQLLAAPRLAPWVRAAAPQIEKKLLYLRLASGRGAEYPVLASGEIPSLMAAVGVPALLAAGRWEDDSLDRQWRDPRPAELRREIDHFHLPPASVANDRSWAEWHYFNVLSADGRRWAFISFIIVGRVRAGTWGGQVLVTLHESGKPARCFVSSATPAATRFSTNDADVRVGASRVTVLPDGRYDVHATARGEDGTPVDVRLTIAPAPYAYFPGAALATGELVSGYVVPALRAGATGAICAAGQCERYADAQAYHDHNWGVWRGVTWEWGAARAGTFSVLYGRVQPPPDSGTASLQPLFVYVVDSLGFAGLFRPREIRYSGSRTIVVDGHDVALPTRGEMFDARGDDTLRVELDVDDASATDTSVPVAERGASGTARRTTHPYFIQMKGTMRLSGRLNGQRIDARGAGFFETYR